MIQRDVEISPASAATGPRRKGVTARLAALAVISVLAAGCGAGEGTDRAASSEDGSLVVGVRNATVPQASLYWAAAKGYFKDAGLDLSIKAGEAAHSAQLVAGQVDLSMGAQGALFGVINSGKRVTAIYGSDSGISGWVVTSSDSVKTPTDCKSVTTATPGTVLYAWTRQLEKVYDVEWKITQLTTVPAIAANVIGGRTDCATGNVSFYQSGIDSGKLRVILDPTDKSSLPPGWPALGVEDVFGGIPERLKAKKPAVERFLRAYDTALSDYLAADSKDIARTLISYDPQWAAVGSVDVLAEAVEKFKPLLSPDKGYISEDVWSRTLAFYETGGLDFLASDSSRFDYASAVDMSYYKAAIGE
ncbi:ABC transporter substrate-binding protein [Acrocarpospora sp. B8E8]|uniref:ABC transporter substrate-binding protein n=1 Tax=Acrocarpospora sp. B8E8 TaxID=3153572 RepID=UPI00325E665B